MNKGYHLYLDNFSNTKKLARYLYEHETWVNGTVRLGRNGIPKQLLGRFPVGKKVYVRKGPVLQMAFREKATNKSQFILLSTNAKVQNMRYKIRRSGKVVIKSKPQIVYEYNHGMGGIDGTDQMLYTYLDERRASKHRKKVIFNIFGRKALNAYVLYKQNTEKPMPRILFQISVLESLTQELQIEKNRAVPIGPGGDGPRVFTYGVMRIENNKEKECCVCSGPRNPDGKRRRARTECAKCKKGLHLDCIPQHNCN